MTEIERPLEKIIEHGSMSFMLIDGIDTFLPNLEVRISYLSLFFRTISFPLTLSHFLCHMHTHMYLSHA